MTRLLLVCGSQRAGSLNARLLDRVAALLPPGVALDRLRPAEVALPLFDADIEGEPALRAEVRRLHARFAAADALVVASPEYNGLMTPWLKNLVDWVSRVPRTDPGAANAFLDRPVLLCAATPGWSGGQLGLTALRGLFGYLGAVPFGETIAMPYAEHRFAEAGDGPIDSEAEWADCAARFCRLAGHRGGASLAA